ncbi:MAG: DUF1232 domain-containing protein [Bryobacteraceae bacterium]|nr:DUF1232 domain-containing protein [Bryobacteraceae bacterium]MDW8379427.1 DUF1232 domain-containing protein [Bryobacterales bacterium]
MGESFIFSAKLIGAVVLLYVAYRLLRFSLRVWLAWKMVRRAGFALKALIASAAGAVYGLSPLDALPDWIVGAGWLDDFLVLLAVWFYLKYLGKPRPWSLVTPVASNRLAPSARPSKSAFARWLPSLNR